MMMGGGGDEGVSTTVTMMGGGCKEEDEEHRGRVKKNRKIGIINLEWDEKNKSVVAKREQIALSKTHLRNNINVALADVLSLPPQLFHPHTLNQLLSFQVWETVLSENERQYLMQFLPQGVDMHQVVQELLGGTSNFHFGNPFLKWSASLCSGNLHPDAILHQERGIRASKKTYYTGLVKYHRGMINSLLMWKEWWSSSKHPEDKVLQEMWRSRKQAGNRSSDVNEYRTYKVKENAAGTSESDSSMAEDNADSSDYENSVKRDGELQKGKMTMKDRNDNLVSGLKVLDRSRKGERIHKQSIRSNDGSKYMTYIKVSRKQHQRVKSSMKHSSNSIQSKSLSRVLGDLQSFHVQPFKVFEEEEQKKLHAHWLQLAIKDVPTAFTNFSKWQLAKSQLPHYWKQEMNEKLVFLNVADHDEEIDKPHIVSPALVDIEAPNYEVADAMEADHDEEIDKPHIVSPALVNIGAPNYEVADPMEMEENQLSNCALQEHIDDRAKDDKLIIQPEIVKKENINNIMEEGKTNEKGSLEPPASEQEYQFANVSVHNQHLRKITELRGEDRICPIETDSDKYVIMERDDSQVIESRHSGNLTRVEANAVGQDSLFSTSSNIWPLDSIRNSYHHPTSNSNVGSLHLLSPGNPLEPQARLINLESGNDKEVAENIMWHKQSHDGPFLSPYSADQIVQAQNELLHHHYLNTPNTSLHHNHEQEHSQFDLQASSSVPVGRSQYSSSIGEQLHMPMPLVDLTQEKNLLQHHMPSVQNIQHDWVANTPNQILSPFQSRLRLGELVGNDRLGRDELIHGGWSNLESSSHVAGFSNRSNIDESLYGVDLSHFNSSNNNDNAQLPYAAPFDSVQDHPQQLIGSEFGYSGGVSLFPSSTIDNVLLDPHGNLVSDQVTSSSLSAPQSPLVEKNNSLVVGGTEWINVPPHQNSAIQEESMIKPFSRPWNS